jgi:hypothetical protein
VNRNGRRRRPSSDRPDRRKGFVLDLDRLEGFRRDIFIDRRHGRDRVADEADPVETERVLVLGDREDAEGDRSSRPVIAASTPGIARAFETSSRRMRACASFERRILQWSIRGRKRSSANRVWPVTFAAASTLR